MARSFNGTSDKISLGTGVALSTNSPWTASAWIYITTLPAASGFQGIFAKRNPSNAQYEIFIQNVSGTTGFGAYNNVNFKSFGTLTTNTWYNVVAACDASSFIAYINGVNSGADALNYNTSAITGQNVQIGSDGASPENFFAGRIADVALWNNVKLSAGEAAALGNGARPWTIRPSALFGWWPLDGLASPEPDLSGNVANGTLTGTASAFGPPFMQFTPRSPHVIFGTAAAAGGPAFIAARALGANLIYEGFARH